MMELFDDFRDILVELHEAGARFVVLGGHAGHHKQKMQTWLAILVQQIGERVIRKARTWTGFRLAMTARLPATIALLFVRRMRTSIALKRPFKDGT